jgi:A/G-specific adenine glycosylase
MRTSGHSERTEPPSSNDAKLGRALAAWFEKNKRDLPWRRTRDPYAILVSEVMLQQTTVAAVIPYYEKWLRRFPTIRALARANESQVLHAWQGLGYYSRARNLHRCAQICGRRFRGRLPGDIAALRSLPGIGRYIANAVAVFALDQSLPVVEANTARVLARLFNIRVCIDSTAGREKLWDAAARLVPKFRARDFQSAMMDLGALVCVAGKPCCRVCPIRKFCAAPDPHSLPARRKRPAVISLIESHSFIRRGNEILLDQCRSRWRGLWMLPANSSPFRNLLYSARFPFTHHQVTLRVSPGKVRSRKAGERWFSISMLNKIPIPSPHRRAILSIISSQAEG